MTIESNRTRANDNLCEFPKAKTCLPGTDDSTWSPTFDIHHRLPQEVWHHILTFLYPSQIARLSRVSKAFQEMTSSSFVWSRILKRTVGLEHPTEPLPTISVLKSRMLYLCAVSSRIYEQCFLYAVPSSVYERLATRLLPVEITYRNDSGRVVADVTEPTPTSSRRDKGQQQQQSWSIRLCLRCRRLHYLQYPESIPPIIQGRHLSSRGIMTTYLLSAQEISILPSGYIKEANGIVVKLYSEEEACRMSRRKHGGNVGVAAFQQKEVLTLEAQKTVDRLCEYRRRYLKQPEG